MQHLPTYIQDIPIAISDVVESSEQPIITDKLNHEKLNQVTGKESLRQKITEEVKQSKQANKKFTILFLNFDRYRDSICRFNGSTEHKNSDEAVNIIARRLQQCSRDCDLICRCDNNEFIFLLPEICNENEINTIVQMIYHHLREPLFIQNRKQPEVTSSIGISVYPDNGNNTNILLQNACLAMHQAKKDGGNTHCYYTGD